MTRATFTALPVIHLEITGPTDKVVAAMRWAGREGIAAEVRGSRSGPIPARNGCSFWSVDFAPDHADRLVAYLREQGFEGT